MQNNSRTQLLTCYADNFFDEAPIFSGLASELGDSSFFITGATGLFGSWIINFLHWATKRGFAEPRVMTLVRREAPFLPNICAFLACLNPADPDPIIKHFFIFN